MYAAMRHVLSIWSFIYNNTWQLSREYVKYSHNEFNWDFASEICFFFLRSDRCKGCGTVGMCRQAGSSLAIHHYNGPRIIARDGMPHDTIGNFRLAIEHKYVHAYFPINPVTFLIWCTKKIDTHKIYFHLNHNCSELWVYALQIKNRIIWILFVYSFAFAEGWMLEWYISSKFNFQKQNKKSQKIFHYWTIIWVFYFLFHLLSVQQQNKN